MWFWVRHTIYIGVFLIQDRVIIKVAVIETGDIVVAFIYIYHFDENIKQDSPPIARFIDYFLTCLTRLFKNSCYMYRVEKAEI